MAVLAWEPHRTHPLRDRHLGYVIADAVRLFPDRVAVLDAAHALTYAELDRRADSVAGDLIDRGVTVGDRVALLWANDARYPECLLGVMRAGAVALPLNPKLGDEALGYILDDANVVGIVAGPDSIGRSERLITGRHCFVVNSEDAPSDAPSFAPPVLDADALCMQPYTSGSTGQPKGVLLTHAGQLWNVESVRSALMLTERDRALIVIPMFHVNAGITMLVMLRAGGTLVVLPGFDPDAALRAMVAHRCTMVGGVPAIFRALVAARRRAPGPDVSSLRLAVVGSAPVQPDLPSAFQSTFGVSLREGYGLTEGGPYVSLTPVWGVVRPGSAGLPIPGCEIRVLDGEGRELPAGEPGELWVRNPGVTVGYHRRPELTESRLRDGWVSTGDVARLDADGFVTILGRVDDMLNVAGENVYPKEVEQILLGHPDVLDAVVIGIDHPEKGQVPAAVVRADSAQLKETALKQFFIERGPAYAHPRRIVFVEEIPVLATGKPDRAAVRALLEERG